MRTDLSEEAVATMGSVGWGADIHERVFEAGVRVARGCTRSGRGDGSSEGILNKSWEESYYSQSPDVCCF